MGHHGRHPASSTKLIEGVVSVRLFIGNLPYAATEAELREHLSSVGAPTQIVLPTDRETGRPRGFAFVDYADRGVAEEAIRRFNQQPFKGRPLAVSEARPREERPAGPRPGGGGYGAPRPSGPPGGYTGGPPRTGGFSPRPSDGGGAPASRSRNFGPDAPPKNKGSRRARNQSAGRAVRSRNGPSDASTTPTRIGASRRARPRWTTSPPARRTTTSTTTRSETSRQRRASEPPSDRTWTPTSEYSASFTSRSGCWD